MEQAAKPYSEHWNRVMEELLALDFTLDPTFNIYEASRIYIALGAQNGTKTTPFLAYGAFINPLKFRMILLAFLGNRARNCLEKELSTLDDLVNEYKTVGEE